MSESIGDALRALSVLCEAAERLSQGHEVHTAPLLASYASLRPAGHAAAGAHSLDLEFLGAVRGMGEELWGARVLELQRSVVRATPFLVPRGDDAVTLLVPPGLEGPGDALALILGVATESAKLQRLAAEGAEGPLLPKVAAALGCPPLEVVDRMECVGDRDTAEALLQRLCVAGPNRSVRSPAGAAAGTAPVEAAFRGRSDRGGPLFVVAGATERLHDLVSPWVRRLQGPLAKLAGTRHSDDLYALLPHLFAEDPQLHEERINVEHDEGALIPVSDALLIRFEHLDTTLVDERARAVVTQLKRSRARAVLCGRRQECLQEVLLAAGSEARVIVVLGEAIGAHSLYPDMVIDGRTSHPLELHNAFHPFTEDPTGTSSVVLSPPSLGFCPSLLLTQQVGSAPLLGPLALCVAHARAAGALPRGARLAAAVFPPGDAQSASDVALGCLGRMAGASQSASSKARGRQR